MKKTIILLLSIFSYSAFAQQVDFSAYFKQAEKLNVNKLEQYVQQVFGNKAAEIKTSGRFEDYKKLFTNRMAVAIIPVSENLKIQSTDEVGLMSDYNNKLKLDTSFSAATFNPLKYKINFNADEVVAYRISNTDFVIIILAQ